ncbi:MAG: hypothetical protein WAR22_10525 [Desulfomonilia bacterium]|jgi:hypothetical protein
MKIIAFSLSLFIAAVGALGAASPAMLVSALRRLASPAGIYVLTVIRLATGAAYSLSASASRIPGALRVLGGLSIVSGAITPLVGAERFRKLLAWWTSRGISFVRLWSIVALAAGVLLAWSTAPGIRKRIAHQAPEAVPPSEPAGAEEPA